MSPGDTVLTFDTGHFATLWRAMAVRLGLAVETADADWRRGIRADMVADRLAADRQHRIKAVMVVHNETSTGVTSAIPPLRAAIDEVRHPALLFVDTVSSLGSMDYKHDAWGVDVTIWGSQKGMM